MITMTEIECETCGAVYYLCNANLIVVEDDEDDALICPQCKSDEVRENGTIDVIQFANDTRENGGER